MIFHNEDETMLEDDRYRFALTAHSLEVSTRVHECLAGISDTIHTRIITFEEAVPEARRLLSEGYEVILCHGGTGEAIISQIGHSVVQIQKTDMDIIKALLKAGRLADEVALTLSVNESGDVEELQNLTGLRIHPVTYASSEELIEGVREVFGQGIKVVVGGGVSRQFMENLGGAGIIIEPNPHSINLALVQARAIAKAKREEASSREQIIAILKLLSEGVICIDNAGNIVFSNAKANRLLKITPHISQNEMLSRYLDDLFLNQVLQDGRPRLDVITTINREKLLVNTLPVSIHARMHGAVALFRDIASLQNINRKIREELLIRGLVAHHVVEDIKGNSPPVQRLVTKIRKYAPCDASVLIQGETGSGKELVAHSLHNLSTRKEQPFIAINCAALPESLLESELFGYEEGAFTGAKRGGKAGLFELANHGTIFLDEIGEISHRVQLRLLRVLEAKELMRVGGDRIVPVDVRIISASHKMLSDLVRQGQFRLDLYYRLGVIQLRVPPLRQRLEDVPVLIRDLLARYGKGLETITPRMTEAIGRYSWPGNVRELNSLVESYLILLGNEKVDEELFFDLFSERVMELENGDAGVPRNGNGAGGGTLKEQMETLRREIVLKTVGETGQDKNLASRKLGISYNTLWRIMSGK